MKITSTIRPGLIAAAIVAASIAITGCSNTPTAEPAQSSESASTEVQATATLTIQDPWVKAVDSGMTGAFGTLVNDTDNDIVVTGAQTPLLDNAELHEMVEDSTGAMVMKPVESITVPARGTFALAPGAHHIMLMGVTKKISAGDEIPFKLELADGTSMEFTALAKEFAGANETYVGDDMGDMNDMNHDMGSGE